MRGGNVMEVTFLVALEILSFIATIHGVHPGCECLVFSGTFGKEKGIFKSPDFPKPYSPNIDCLLYTFIGSQNEIIEITFLDFDVRKANLNCLQGDYVKLFLHLESGEINEYTPWTALLCGSMADIPTVLYSSGPGLVLEFHSGATTTNASGFSGTFRFIDRRLFRTDGQKLPGTMCDYQFISANHSPTFGRFYSPRYPSSYPPNVRCSYRFKASCLNRADLIRVYDGRSTSDPSIRILCNQGTELEVISTDSELFVEFVANSDWPGQGFKASFHFEPIADNSVDPQRRPGQFSYPSEVILSASETRTSCDVFLNSDINKNGTIASPSYPAPYPAKVNCRYEFRGRGKERIQVVFQDFNLFHPRDDSKDCENQDSLVAFVHLEGKMEKIDTFCGSTLPKPIMSNGPRLNLEFHSTQAARYAKGFKATYSFTEDFGIKTGAQLTEYPCAFVYNSNVSKSGVFYSPNYPGFYPRDTECYYYFNGYDNERVHLHFHYFDVEGVLPCEAITASDYVEFSNYMVRDRKHKRYCGQLKEFDVESDRKFFRVAFKSNDRLDGTGFNATYQFLDATETYTGKPDHTSTTTSFKGFSGIIIILVIATCYIS